MQKLHDSLQSIAAVLDDLFNGEGPKPAGSRKVGFVLLTFNLGQTEGGQVNYVSNCQREEMVTALKELLARWEGRYVETDAKVPQ